MILKTTVSRKWAKRFCLLLLIVLFRPRFLVGEDVRTSVDDNPAWPCDLTNWSTPRYGEFRAKHPPVWHNLENNRPNIRAPDMPWGASEKPKLTCSLAISRSRYNWLKTRGNVSVVWLAHFSSKIGAIRRSKKPPGSVTLERSATLSGAASRVHGKWMKCGLVNNKTIIGVSYIRPLVKCQDQPVLTGPPNPIFEGDRTLFKCSVVVCKGVQASSVRLTFQATNSPSLTVPHSENPKKKTKNVGGATIVSFEQRYTFPLAADGAIIKCLRSDKQTDESHSLPVRVLARPAKLDITGPATTYAGKQERWRCSVTNVSHDFPNVILKSPSQVATGKQESMAQRKNERNQCLFDSSVVLCMAFSTPAEKARLVCTVYMYSYHRYLAISKVKYVKVKPSKDSNYFPKDWLPPDVEDGGGSGSTNGSDAGAGGASGGKKICCGREEFPLEDKDTSFTLEEYLPQAQIFVNLDGPSKEGICKNIKSTLCSKMMKYKCSATLPDGKVKDKHFSTPLPGSLSGVNVVISPKKKSYKAGDTVAATCTATGVESTSITWFVEECDGSMVTYEGKVSEPKVTSTDSRCPQEVTVTSTIEEMKIGEEVCGIKCFSGIIVGNTTLEQGSGATVFGKKSDDDDEGVLGLAWFKILILAFLTLILLLLLLCLWRVLRGQESPKQEEPAEEVAETIDTGLEPETRESNLSYASDVDTGISEQLTKSDANSSSDMSEVSEDSSFFDIKVDDSTQPISRFG